jgi:poly-gamma-glutamate synthesis protein (capsule biosynthesis protein)
MAHSVNYSMADYDRIYDGVREELRSDDLTFANLETPVVPDHPYESYPRFNVKPPYVEAAVDAGVEVFSTANNHATDRGRDGVHATRRSLSRLADRGSVFSSGLRSAPGAEFSVTTISVGEVSMGFVAACQILNIPHDGGRLVHTVDYRDVDAVEGFVEWVARQASEFDLFVLSYHGGREYELRPDPAKVRFFDRLVAAGVDVVWSHHPHVVQPWRRIERSDGSHALVLNSTGNFISGQTWGLGPEAADLPRAYTGDSALFRLEVSFAGDGGPRISHEPVLIANYRDPEHGMVVRKMDQLVADDIGPQWKRYYVVRRNALREIIWRSEEVRLAALD